jgi:large subunit ribosomal protein L13
MKKETHTIDVKGKVLGRVASEIAVLLRGKSRADFAPNKDAGDVVVVKNIDKIKVTGKKYANKIYYRHSGYLGSLKERTYKELFEKNPSDVLRRAVYGMLPKNKLRDKQIKRLKFE